LEQTKAACSGRQRSIDLKKTKPQKKKTPHGSCHAPAGRREMPKARTEWVGTKDVEQGVGKLNDPYVSSPRWSNPGNAKWGTDADTDLTIRIGALPAANCFRH